MDNYTANERQQTHFTGNDFVVIVPTKDRQKKLAKLLDSLSTQTIKCGRVIIIDGGTSIEKLVLSYQDRLPVEYYLCQPPGQIRQRNFGISLLNESTPLVASFDDDIVLEPGAISAMIDCWNRYGPETAGIGFNIINMSEEKKTWWRKVFLMTTDLPGRVLVSGATSAYCPAGEDLRCQWLCGGATVWKLEILKRHPHQEIRSRWAIGEDIIFSYPIGQSKPLYVCATACVKHEHEPDFEKNKPFRFHGISRSLWMLFFVISNRKLSLVAFLWMSMGSILGKFFYGLIFGRRDNLEFAAGLASGIKSGLLAIMRKRSLTEVIEKETAHVI